MNFNRYSLEELLNAWDLYHRAHIDANDLAFNTNVGDKHFWAIEALMKAARDDPEFCWDFILKSAKTKTGDLDLAYLAAGPLEDLLHYHKETYIDRLKEIAEKDEIIFRLGQNILPPL